ncbi:MAG TPA: hypothetical protein PKE49_08875 [Leptospiraceae bacterium]|jgi:hypothetical protein|nr:hypothetical protein [Leptospirales bacterium]HMU84455.1 hypothetical protein [Leptospiraceae bacterium]HMW58079.1 hypothetical protein [Leptospiraceae bacterium]HMX56625.1 hypothetical protein [Leptospiraceae bacterium]HMY44567.1 hypothetical protein [Leptospiraceae bacterium]
MGFTPRQFKLVQAAAGSLESLGIAREEAIILISNSIQEELTALGLTMEQVDAKSRTERFAFIRTLAARMEKTIHTRGVMLGQIRAAMEEFMEALRQSWQEETR